ncbi:hypothetical protein AQUSIP_24950 [Aquicella siphonis]|uniref:Uncharacterized protein n=1 Tax=Aquicella siphonis TaxID=254247 RepID=A0A5E4PKT3_9COXI|nr:replication initiation protein [Aquicella siphonis]VVC77168.1 hypothetical protein AQUSIP_24950 [Aquicella siphonis]
MKKSTQKILIQNLFLASSTPLTLADRRLYNYLLHNAFHHFLKQDSFKILLTELIGVYGAGLPPLERLKESFRRLIRTLIEYEVDGKWNITSLLEKAELDEKLEQVTYSYPVECKMLFKDPIILEKSLIQAHFTQKYSNLLYEILATAHYAKKSTLSLEITDLRSRLHIHEGKLTNFSDLDRFALVPAIKEINSYASFAVKYFTKRKGMKVTDVIFEMTSKRDISNTENVIPPKRPRLFIDNPDMERAYAYLLNAETDERRKFFDLARKTAEKKNKRITEEEFDRPDLWFKWVERQLLTKTKD